MRTFLVCKILVLCYFAISCSGPGFAYRIQTENMMPTLNPGDMCTANPFAYWSAPVERFDMVVFLAPSEQRKRFGLPEGTRYISRVVGLPGEKIEVRRGVVYINNIAWDEPFEIIRDDLDFPTITIPKDEYFLIGDNRPGSDDSRYYKPPTIKKADIAGKILDIYPGYYKK